MAEAFKPPLVVMMLTELTSGRLTVASKTLLWLCATGGEAEHGRELSTGEAAVYALLRTPKRRRDWLLGRRTAKRLIQLALQDRGYDLRPEEIVILSHPDGWPQVSLPALGRAAPPLTLTISHAAGRAFCAVAFGADIPLGADLEVIQPRSPGFIADYFTADERDLVAAAGDTRPTFVNAIWSGKEAALKAIRRGLAEDTRLVTCLPLTDGDEGSWRPLRYRWEAVGRALPPLEGWWREQGGFVLTLAVSSSIGVAL